MRTLFACLLVSALLSSSLAWAEDPILQRQELMENTKDALGPMIGMAKGEVEFDAATVQSSLLTMQITAAEAGALFPEGSESGHDTEAKASIWSDRAGFEQAMADFDVAVKAALDAAPASVDERKPALNGVLKTCKGCHDGYRVEKEE